MKFFMRQTVRNIARHRKKSILHILIGVLTVLILDVYATADSSDRGRRLKIKIFNREICACALLDTN